MMARLLQARDGDPKTVETSGQGKKEKSARLNKVKYTHIVLNGEGMSGTAIEEAPGGSLDVSHDRRVSAGAEASRRLGKT